MQSKNTHNKHHYAVVIGGANVDICAASQNGLRERTSNPGKITTSLGGVGRNIAENLTLLDVDCRLISVVGSDPYGDQIISEGKAAGINMDHVSIANDASTSTYVSILDHDGDMMMAISDMSITDYINIKEKQNLIECAEIVIADTNLSEDTLQDLVEFFDNKPLIIDTVSVAKAPRIIPYLKSIHTLKANHTEAISICGQDMELSDMAAQLHREGVRNIFITLGSEGVFYSDGKEQALLKAKPCEVINGNGAGDAFTAAVGYGHIQGWTVAKTASFAQNAAQVALSHPNTINPEMSLAAINKLKENRK